MKRIWAGWFERLFSKNLDSDFVGYLWRIGLRHVEINLDQRFSNLGFSLARKFCHQLAVENFPASLAAEIMPVVDKLIDFCILVETSAYIDASVHCDLEILKGIADKIRNPVTIIGGNLRRLQRHVDPKATLFGDYEFLISSTRHCEDMIADITTYMDIFERETRPEECMLETIIDNMLEKLSQRKKLDGVKVEVIISPDARFVRATHRAAPPLLPHVGKRFGRCPLGKRALCAHNFITTGRSSSHREIDIFNNGEVINLSNISNILTPF
jgi:signal transduction histidine kinase